MEQAWTNKLTSFKTVLLNIPDRLAGRLAAMTDEREIRALLDAEIKLALNSLIEQHNDAA